MADDKFSKLLTILKKMQSAVLAYSGGVDSTFLLKAAQLAGIRTLAVTAVSETMPKDDFLLAKKVAREAGIKHRIIRTSELTNEKFSKNPPDRCFYCKDELFSRLRKIAVRGRYRFVLDGSNLDDMDDWRPGRKAAQKHSVRSPLIEAGFNKKEIRRMSYKLGLPTWDRPSSPCLASRFPYGEPITKRALNQIAEAERFLKSLGFVELRVRHHRDFARIEVREENMEQILEPDIRKAVTDKLRSLGYRYVSLDLEGYRSGRMNERLKKTDGKRRLPE